MGARHEVDEDFSIGIRSVGTAECRHYAVGTAPSDRSAGGGAVASAATAVGWRSGASAPRRTAAHSAAAACAQHARTSRTSLRAARTGGRRQRRRQRARAHEAAVLCAGAAPRSRARCRSVRAARAHLAARGSGTTGAASARAAPEARGSVESAVRCRAWCVLHTRIKVGRCRAPQRAGGGL